MFSIAIERSEMIPRLSVAALAAVLLTTILMPQATVMAQQTSRSQMVPGELIIGYINSEGRNRALSTFTANAVGLRLLNGEAPEDITVERLGPDAIRMRFRLPAGARLLIQSDAGAEQRMLEDLAAKLKAADNQIEFAHPNWIIRLPMPSKGGPQGIDEKRKSNIRDKEGPNDPVYVQRLHWHYAPPPMGMNAVGAWRVTTGSNSIVVAVIDDGIVSKHADIARAKNLLEGYSFLSSGRTPGAEMCQSGISHGTHVAGTIGVAGTNNNTGIAGLNWSISILPIRVFDCDYGTTLVDISDAIRWSAGLEVEGVPINRSPAHVINLSLGGRSPCAVEIVGYMRKAVIDAQRAGSTIVAAAGNDNADATSNYPSSCPGVISVAAHDSKGRIARYSNYGVEGAVTILAPGGDINQRSERGQSLGVWSIVAASPRNRQGVAAENGTSMAAPHVSGAIALAMAKYPALRGDPGRVRAALRVTAVTVKREACPKGCGYGQLDAGALVSLEKLPPPDAINEDRIASRPGTLPPQASVVDRSAPSTPRYHGQWLSLDSGVRIEIEGSEWRHSTKGLARLREATNAGDFDIFYHEGHLRCGYRFLIIGDGREMMLASSDRGQSSDHCPVGRFIKIER